MRRSRVDLDLEERASRRVDALGVFPLEAALLFFLIIIAMSFSKRPAESVGSKPIVLASPAEPAESRSIHLKLNIILSESS